MAILDAAERWAQALLGRAGRGGRRQSALAPWDEMAYFDAPRWTLTQMVVGQSIQVVGANSQRVVLMFAAPAGIADPEISTRDDLGATKNLLVKSGNLPLIFTQRDHGPLCQAQWFGTSTAAVNLTVVEVVLREWPRA